MSNILQAQIIDEKLLMELCEQITGDWCLWVQKGNTLYILNDRLGRLPLYYFDNGEILFVGRHMALLQQMKLLEFDKFGAASFLWSGYYIGHRTLYKDVKRLPGGSLVVIDLSNGKAIINAGKQLNFDARNTAPLQQQAGELADLFSRACQRMAHSWPGLINISQSGGQDSRAVAVAMANTAGTDRLVASSFVMAGAEKDANLGKQIADRLYIPFHSYPIHNQFVYEQELMENKRGMNYLGMAFIHDFYKQMLQRHHSFMYVTGDGGDKALPYLGEKKSNLSLDELVIQLGKRHSMTPIEDIAAMTNISTDEFMELIYETVAAYPEEKMNNRSIHFSIYERAVQCFFEAEDRSRFFAWSTTPFYDLDFFKLAMQVPDKFKKHYRIYRPFQNALSRTIADIPDASGHSINSWKFIARKSVQELFRSAPPNIKNMVRKLGGVAIAKNSGTTAEHQLLVSELCEYPVFHHLLNPQAVAKFLPTANQEQYQHLRTIVMARQFL